ncbi:MAG: exodeoxyribonuclease VII large subunit [Candidatus Kerfeldbacteria bacterium]|nr:exodeoxyribonuclease VII large subunit [Candidatus Kerfeldbacteria bacterium]
MKIYSVTEFRDELNELLSQAVVTIEGEIAEFQISQGKFVWFSLVDEETTIKCFMMAFQLHMPIEDGMKVRVVGAPSMFKKGQMVFKPRTIEPVGDGSVQKALEALKKKLQVEGLFDEGRKRTLPEYPQRIAVITSKDAAAYTDILRILNNRWGGLTVVLVHVQVQGARAVSSIVSGFASLQEDRGIEAIILARGGGSKDDLAAFNTEEVARAIFGARVPVISAVGHERDTTIADMVADVRASTPSNAAERIVPDRTEMVTLIDQYVQLAEQRVRAGITSTHHRVDEALYGATRAIERVSDTVDVLSQKLQMHLTVREQRVIRALESVMQKEELLKSLHPLRVLERGFTLTTDESGAVVRSATQVHSRAKLQTRTAKGTITSIVE